MYLMSGRGAEIYSDRNSGLGVDWFHFTQAQHMKVPARLELIAHWCSASIQSPLRGAVLACRIRRSISIGSHTNKRAYGRE